MEIFLRSGEERSITAEPWLASWGLVPIPESSAEPRAVLQIGLLAQLEPANHSQVSPRCSPGLPWGSLGPRALRGSPGSPGLPWGTLGESWELQGALGLPRELQGAQGSLEGEKNSWPSELGVGLASWELAWSRVHHLLHGLSLIHI